jgi:hypothetical protein|tara:strand:- start:1093 stop:1956 length:864 start_codon:yes stop_codon:yes gene_type:complete
MSRDIIITNKQLEVFKSLIKEDELPQKNVRAYSFDWDDNIMNMPTKIKLLERTPDGWKNIEVSTEEFAKIRNNTNFKLTDDSFNGFIDDDTFMVDLKTALDTKSFAPSFEKFKEALLYANPISIITARGHKPETLRKGMDLVISYILNEDELNTMIDNIQQEYPELDGENIETTLSTYLDSQDYHPVTSNIFAEKFGLDNESALNPEENKKIALRDYVTKIVQKTKEMVGTEYNKLSIGFSDDDLGNINAITDFIKEVLQLEFPQVDFVVYDTSEGEINKIIVKQLN